MAQDDLRRAVERDLARLNLMARHALGTTPWRSIAVRSATFPEVNAWPSWAPEPGDWVRAAWQGAERSDRVNARTWHVAGNRLCLVEPWLFYLTPLCGRDIEVEPYGHALSSEGRYRTFDAGPPADAKRCMHCTRRLARGPVGDGDIIKPWGDEGAAAHEERMGWTRR